MKLRKKFKKETGMNAYVNRVGRNVEFHQTYTIWLEKKLNEGFKLNLQNASNSVCKICGKPAFKSDNHLCFEHLVCNVSKRPKQTDC